MVESKVNSSLKRWWPPPFRAKTMAYAGWATTLTVGRENALRLLAEAQPVANMSPSERSEHVHWALARLQDGWDDDIVTQRAATLEAAHCRLRQTVPGGQATVEPHRPPDIIGCYVLTPAGV